MFANLIESASHQQDLARKGRFFLATLISYVLVIGCAGLVSIYAYDTHVDENLDLEFIGLVPPIMDEQPSPEAKKAGPKASKTTEQKNTPAQRIVAINRIDDPTKIPDKVSAEKSSVPEIPKYGGYTIGPSNTEAILGGPLGSDNAGGDGDGGPGPVVRIETKPPPATEKPADPPKVIYKSRVLNGEATLLPKPPYPPIARSVRAEGSVNVQIMIDESGKILSARASTGNPLLRSAAEQAAYKARFKPTLLNGVPVKVSGIIIYNFTLQ